MRQGADRYAQGDLSLRLQPPSTQELAALAQAMSQKHVSVSIVAVVTGCIAPGLKTTNQMAHELERRIQTVINQRNETQAVFSSMAEGVMALDMHENIMDLNAAAARLLIRPKVDLK